jgi:hypothetical protein
MVDFISIVVTSMLPEGIKQTKSAIALWTPSAFASGCYLIFIGSFLVCAQGRFAACGEVAGLVFPL